MQPKYHDEPYLALIHNVLENGFIKDDRTGTGTISTFVQQMRFDLSGGSIPLLTTKQLHTKSIIHELIWFLKGDTNIKYLNDNGVTIWDEWADENGDLGPVYGKQWRDWGGKADSFAVGNGAYGSSIGIDQIAIVVDQLYNDPDSRRIIVNAWNVSEIDQMALPPCHAMFQFYSRKLSMEEQNDWFNTNIDMADYDCPISIEAKHEYFDRHDVPTRALSCHLYQRSCDLGLGVPFNIAQYSILTHLMAHVTGHVADEFVWTGGDVHIYKNHVDKLQQQVTRLPFASPILSINQERENLEDFTYEDFQIIDYVAHPAIKMKVSV